MINITSERMSADVTITYSQGISYITINGSRINSGWHGLLYHGDTINIYSCFGNMEWYYGDDNGIYFKTSTMIYKNVTSPSGTGTLYFYGTQTPYPGYYVIRGGACSNWTFN